MIQGPTFLLPVDKPKTINPAKAVAIQIWSKKSLYRGLEVITSNFPKSLAHCLTIASSNTGRPAAAYENQNRRMAK
ncbi:hypothetical protein E4U40_004219 [Claviceps sp. LM458 group G5]|nr:hypothetical protein E4U40_004219 [Claviceps sp. LM458 group G5]